MFQAASVRALQPAQHCERGCGGAGRGRGRTGRGGPRPPHHAAPRFPRRVARLPAPARGTWPGPLCLPGTGRARPAHLPARPAALQQGGATAGLREATSGEL